MSIYIYKSLEPKIKEIADYLSLVNDINRIVKTKIKN